MKIDPCQHLSEMKTSPDSLLQGKIPGVTKEKEQIMPRQMQASLSSHLIDSNLLLLKELLRASK
jgi:hypothetical protein